MKQQEYIKNYCAGCGLCEAANGKKLESDKRGFPTVVLSDNEDVSFYQEVCPVFYYQNECKDGIWGKVNTAIVTYSADEEIRFKAASGGALTELAIYLLEAGLVDGIVHTTYNVESPTETVSCISYSADAVRQRCGSRYSISVPLSDILHMVDKDKKYAFIGKPCDVMALRQYMNKHEEWQKVFYCLLSFFCAGEPSVDAQKALLNRMGLTLEECKEITYRGNGWPGYTTVKKSDGSECKLEYNTAWGQYLGRDLRNICRFCLDGTGEAADIACADFWCLTEEGKPDFSEHEGRNIAISRTAIGEKILADALASGKLVLEQDFTNKMDEFHKYQPHQYRRKNTMQSMMFAMKFCGRKVPKYNKSYLAEYAKHASNKQKFDAFLGIIKRVIRGRI